MCVCVCVVLCVRACVYACVVWFGLVFCFVCNLSVVDMHSSAHHIDFYV